MIKKVLCGLCVVTGLLGLLYTVGASDLNLIGLETIAIHGLVETFLVVIGSAGLN